MGVLLRYWCNIPCVATAHNQKWQFHWPLNDFVISTSRSTEQFQRHWNLVRKPRIRTIYCPLRHYDRPVNYRQLQTVRRQFGDRDPSRPKKLIGVVGEISYEKGHRYLVDAFAEIHRQDPSTHLVVVGNNREDYVNLMRKRAAELGVGQNIAWAGYRGDIQYVMQALDVYVCPSLRESLPLTVLEAMSASRPIVSTDVGGLPEIMTDRVTGLVIPPKDVSAIRDRVLELLGDQELAIRLGMAARDLTEREFNRQQQGEKIESLYYQVSKAGTEADPRRFQRRQLNHTLPVGPLVTRDSRVA